MYGAKIADACGVTGVNLHMGALRINDLKVCFAPYPRYAFVTAQIVWIIYGSTLYGSQTLYIYSFDTLGRRRRR